MTETIEDRFRVISQHRAAMRVRFRSAFALMFLFQAITLPPREEKGAP